MDELELTNDSTYICENCEEIIKAFTASGETQFCTACGNSNLDGYELGDQ